MIDWRSIDAHRWSDDDYSLGIKYIKEKSIGKPNKKEYNKTDDGWKAFKKKLRVYSLDTSEKYIQLVIDSPEEVPSFFSFTAIQYPIVFTVVKQSQIQETISQFVNAQEQHWAFNYRTLHDKIKRSKLLGISQGDVQKFLKNVPNHFQQTNIKTQQPYVKSYRPMYPYQHWQIDHIEINLANTKYKYVLVIIDIFSKYIYLFPCESTNMTNVSEFLLSLFLNGEIPERIGADNAFDKTALTELFNEYQIKLLIGNPYSPQTQGFVERVNAYIKRFILSHMNRYQQYSFHDILQYVAFGINNTRHSVTGMTPFELHKGRSISVRPLGIDSSNDFNPNVENIEKNEENLIKLDAKVYRHTAEQLHIDRVIHARDKLHTAAEKTELRFQKKFSKERDLVIGDIVRIGTYTLHPDKKIQPHQIRVVDTDDTTTILKNPLFIIRRKDPIFNKVDPARDYHHVIDIAKYPAGSFVKHVRYSKRFYWDVSALTNQKNGGYFKVTEVIDKFNYKLQLYGRTDSRIEFLVDYGNNRWTDSFHRRLLLLADRKELMTAVTRPTYKAMINLGVSTICNERPSLVRRESVPARVGSAPIRRETLAKNIIKNKIREIHDNHEKAIQLYQGIDVSQAHIAAIDMFKKYIGKLKDKRQSKVLQKVRVYHTWYFLEPLYKISWDELFIDNIKQLKPLIWKMKGAAGNSPVNTKGKKNINDVKTTTTTFANYDLELKPTKYKYEPVDLTQYTSYKENPNFWYFFHPHYVIFALSPLDKQKELVKDI